MTHEALVTTAATTHTAILIAGIAAYYKFGDRTEVVSRSLSGTVGTLREMRRLIASELADALAKKLGMPTSGTLVPGEPAQYIERPTSVFSSERFRDTVREFVEESGEVLADCRSLFLYRAAWLRRVKRFSWSLLWLIGYEALVAGLLVFLDRTEVVSLPDSLILWAALPTVLLGLSCGWHVVAMHRAHDRISEIRMWYADLSP